MTSDGSPRTVLVSVDVEPDVAMFVKGKKGLAEGLLRLRDVFDACDVPADYFFTCDAAVAVPDFVREIVAGGHWLGCHGLDHATDYYSRRPEAWQRRAIQEATAGLAGIAGRPPRLFRAPNFSVSPIILQTLDRLHYAADSSVLPGRRKKRYRVLPLLDHRAAPTEPYHPSPTDPCAPGDLGLLEVPVTQNPLAPGGPIGLGFVNACGPQEGLRAIQESEGRVITILCHTWEAIDLGREYPGLPVWLSETCRSDLRGFAEFLKAIRQEYRLGRLQDVVHRARGTAGA